MLHWKGLLVLKEFENERLPKIMPVAYGKMGSENTLGLHTWKPTKATAKK